MNILLDISFNKDNNSITKWIKNKNRVFSISEKFYPKLYVTGYLDLAKIESLPYVKNVHIEKKLAWPKFKPENVMCIEIEQRELYNTAKMLENSGYRTYNVDIGPVRKYVIENEIFPFAKFKNYWYNIIDDDQNAIDYELPEIKCMKFSISSKKENGIMTIRDPIDKITLGDITIDNRSESEIIQQFYYNLIREDPDILLTENGDSFEFPYLIHRSSEYGIDLNLGRDTLNNKNESTYSNDGKSYFSYGRILYKPKMQILSGRFHIDSSSFLFREGGLPGLIEISRITGMPLQECSRLSPGSAITALEINQALRNDIIIPWRRHNAEYWKTAEELLIADRGALILEPRVGLYENVWELDFSSMFPNIMVNHNISPETVLCDCCLDSKKMVPFIGYNICEKRIGLVPKVLKPLIERRMEYKKRKRSDKLRSQEYDNKQNILKWLLVTSFGYMGFNKAIFGKIECHESITAYARDILLRTMELVEDNGYDILHGIVDCLWIKPKTENPKSENPKIENPKVNPEKLCKIISKEIGIDLELKGRFNWIVFLPNKTNYAGSLNRYYGVYDMGASKDAGELKIRGIEMRRRDSPSIIKNLQNDMLIKLADAKNISQFYLKIPESIKILKTYVNNIFSNDIHYDDLIFQISISKECDNYIQFNNQVAALKQLKNKGIQLKPGQSVRYIIADSKTKDYNKRVILPEFVNNYTKYDANKYYRYLLKGAESILLPFGYTEERLDDIINNKTQRKLYEYYLY